MARSAQMYFILKDWILWVPGELLKLEVYDETILGLLKEDSEIKQKHSYEP